MGLATPFEAASRVSGNRLRVEVSHGRARDRGFGGGGGGGGGFGGGGGGYGDRGGRGGYMGAVDILERSRNKGTAYRAIVKGLPASASWQDLKARQHPAQVQMALSHVTRFFELISTNVHIRHGSSIQM